MGSIPWFECAEPHFRMLNLISSSIHHIHSFEFSILVYFYKCICIICILVCTYHANAIRIIRIYLHLPNGVFFAFPAKTAFEPKRCLFFPTTFFLLNPHCGPFWGVMFFFFEKNIVLKRRHFPTKRRHFPTQRRFLPT